MSHANAETLSAYLDRELPDAEARQVEEHLTACAECSRRLDGLRGVVGGLRRLDRLAPPSTLDQLVARRITLAAEEQSLLDRLEGKLNDFQRQSSTLALFAVIVAFAAIILLFSQALEERRQGMTPVIFHDPAPDPDTERALAGRVLQFRDGLWVEEGVAPEAAGQDSTVVVDYGSDDWRALLIANPILVDLPRIEGPVLIRLDDEVVQLRHSPP